MSSDTNAQHLALPGEPAFSTFRIEELKKSINQKLQNQSLPSNHITNISSVYIHYVKPVEHAISKLSDEACLERQQLDQLLSNYQSKKDTLQSLDSALDKSISSPPNSETNLTLYISPRRGTISPWSSKATNIAHVCGLEKSVKRIERGYVMRLTFQKEFDEKHLNLFQDLIHDRMTQV